MSPLGSSQARLTWRSKFQDKGLERSYMSERWPRDAARMRLVCLFTALADLMAILLVDMGHFSGSDFTLMAGARGAAVAIGLGVACLTFLSRRPDRFNVAMAVYMLAVGLHEAVELWLLQPASLNTAQLTVIIVLMFYLFMPPSLAGATIAALGTTAMYLGTAAWGTPVGAVDLSTQCLFFFLVNGFGIYFLANYGRVQRREFWVFREMQRVNQALGEQVKATAEANRLLKELAATDALTGAMSRRRFFEAMEVEFVRARRYGHELSIIMFDLDHFKQVNDRFGHAAGDEVLRHMAGICLSQQRSVDAFGRLGGEEFALMLPETGLDQARQVAERLCAQLAGTAVAVPGGDVVLTMSAGAASLDHTDPDADTLLSRADLAMYEAKRNGRNQMCWLSAVPPADRN